MTLIGGKTASDKFIRVKATGESPVVLARNTIAIGEDVFCGDSVSQVGNIAIGSSSFCSGNGSLVVGRLARANGLNTLSLGQNNFCNADYGIRIGASGTVEGVNAVSIAYRAKAYGQDSVAVGFRAVANQARSIQLGAGGNQIPDSLQYQSVQVANNRLVTPFKIAPEIANTKTANPGEIIPVLTTNNPVIINPVLNPQPLDSFAICDSRSNASVNNITVDFVSNSQLFHGSLANHVIAADKGYAEFLYINNLIGWVLK